MSFRLSQASGILIVFGMLSFFLIAYAYWMQGIGYDRDMVTMHEQVHTRYVCLRAIRQSIVMWVKEHYDAINARVSQQKNPLIYDGGECCMMQQTYHLAISIQGIVHEHCSSGLLLSVAVLDHGITLMRQRCVIEKTPDHIFWVKNYAVD